MAKRNFEQGTKRRLPSTEVQDPNEVKKIKTSDDQQATSPNHVLNQSVDQSSQDDDDDDIFNYNVDGFGVKSTFKLDTDDLSAFDSECKAFKQDLEQQEKELKKTLEVKRINDDLNRQIKEQENQVYQPKQVEETEQISTCLTDVECQQFMKNFKYEYKRFLLVDTSDMTKLSGVVNKVETLLDEVFLIEDFSAKDCFDLLKSMTSELSSKVEYAEEILSSTAEIDCQLNKWRRFSEILFNLGFKKLSESEHHDKEMVMFAAKFALNNLLFGNFERGNTVNYSSGLWKEVIQKGFYFEPESDDEEEGFCSNSRKSVYNGLLQKNYFRIDIEKVSFIFSLLEKEQKNELITSFLDDYGFNGGVEFDIIKLDQIITQFYPLFFTKSVYNLFYGFDPNIYLIISKILLLIVRNSLDLHKDFTTERISQIEIIDGKYSHQDKKFLDNMLEVILNKLEVVIRQQDMNSFYFFYVVTSTFHICMKPDDTFKRSLFAYQKNLGKYNMYVSSLTIFNNSTHENK